MSIMAARNAMGTPALGKKKPRKPYTISRPREKWTADEHERFVHALLVFGRDWKTIELFVGTRTATQIRSHAQKYFLKAYKLGLAAALPPPHPRRAAVLSQPLPTFCFVDDAVAAPSQQSVDWASSRTFSAEACWPDHNDSFMTTPNGGDDVLASGASPRKEADSCFLRHGRSTRSWRDCTAWIPMSRTPSCWC